MSLQILFDPLFRIPFLTGLALAVMLPLLGMYLRLRHEWLAALALAQIASAGALIATLLGIPLLAGGVGLAAVAATAKGRMGRAGDSGYALILLLGWGISILLVANMPIAERVGHALFDGQLYLIGDSQLAIAVALLIGGGLALHRLSRPLLLLRFFPGFFRARAMPERHYTLAFDWLAAIALACATTSVGVIAAFGLVFVPPWIAYGHGGSWSRGLVWSAAVGVACYLVSFILALTLDQPFGPVCALILAFAALISGAMRRAAP